MHRDLRALLRDPSRDNICFIAAAAIAGVATVGAAGVSAYGASKAADKQVEAAGKAADAQLKMYDTTRGDLMPYNKAGQDSLGMLMGRLGEFTSAIPLPEGAPRMSQAFLESTPGYQFALSQGLKGVQNSASARGLGISGAALKGGAGFATGLADNTYQNQFANEQALFANRQQLFNDAVTNQANSYNRLMGVVGIGQNAAAQTGNIGAQTASGVANAYMGAGNAAAGGIIGMSNAASSGLNNLGQLGMMYGMYGGGFG